MQKFYVAIALIAANWLADTSAAAPEPPYTPSPENLAAREWFSNARYGLFIHWGVYSVLEKGEWVMHNDRMTKSEYEKLPSQFNPTRFDPDAWVALCQDAGIRYITITSKHHDGFAMFDSKQGDWDIVDRTPYKTDVLKKLAEACRRGGIKLFFYHSHLDWYQEDYLPLGKTGQHSGRKGTGNFPRYLDRMDAQLSELLTNYGEVGGIWFDGWWDKPNADWRLRQTYDLIHRLQPACLVANNHHVNAFAGEDYQPWERDLPGENKTGYSKDAKVASLPLETCDTINGSWGYNKSDTKHKTPKEILGYLVRAAGSNANLLLNVGPKPDGTIQEDHQQLLRTAGQWLKKYGESVYNTRGGQVGQASWGTTTIDPAGGKVYVHLLQCPESKKLSLPLHGLKTVRARLMSGTGSVAIKLVNQTIELDATKLITDELNTVIVLEEAK